MAGPVGITYKQRQFFQKISKTTFSGLVRSFELKCHEIRACYLEQAQNGGP